MTNSLFQPETDGCELDEADEVGEQLVIARDNRAELLETVEETLDLIALLIGCIVVVSRLLPAASGRNDGGAAALLYGLDQ